MHRGERVNSLWPTDTIWRHKSGSTLAQVMACCLTAPNHCLNQYWLIISKVQWHSSECNEILQPSVTEFSLKITYLKFCLHLPGANELTIVCVKDHSKSCVTHVCIKLQQYKRKQTLTFISGNITWLKNYIHHDIIFFIWAINRYQVFVQVSRIDPLTFWANRYHPSDDLTPDFAGVPSINSLSPGDSNEIFHK